MKAGSGVRIRQGNCSYLRGQRGYALQPDIIGVVWSFEALAAPGAPSAGAGLSVGTGMNAQWAAALLADW